MINITFCIIYVQGSQLLSHQPMIPSFVNIMKNVCSDRVMNMGVVKNQLLLITYEQDQKAMLVGPKECHLVTQCMI